MKIRISETTKFSFKKYSPNIYNRLLVEEIYNLLRNRLEIIDFIEFKIKISKKLTRPLLSFITLPLSKPVSDEGFVLLLDS